MRIEQNEMSGVSVILTAGDSLDLVPETHQDLLDDTVRAAFCDPVAWYRELAQRCPFSEMATWLNESMAESRWELHLNVAGWGNWGQASFIARAEHVCPAWLTPRGTDDEDLSDYLDPLRDFYSLIDSVDWGGFGKSGGLDGPGSFTPLSALRCEWTGANFDPAEALIWGGSSAGHHLLALLDGRAGWAHAEHHEVRLTGSITDLVQWLFAELRAGRAPEWS